MRVGLKADLLGPAGSLPSLVLASTLTPSIAHGHRTTRRAIAALVAVGAGTVLGIAAWLEPSGDGLGTHTQLGVPACGWVSGMGLPCPTCGMTTAFAHAADGNLLESLQCQPAGGILAIATAMALIGGLYVLFTAQTVAPLLRPVGRPAFWWGVGALILSAWLWKIAAFRSWI